MDEIEKKIVEMVEEDRKKSIADREDADKAYNFFFGKLSLKNNSADKSNASKEALARLLEAKIAANNSAIEASKILVALIKEENKRTEINSKLGNYGERLGEIDLANLSEDELEEA